MSAALGNVMYLLRLVLQLLQALVGRLGA